VPAVDADMVLVTEIRAVMLLRPARVLVLLAVLGRLGFPVFRRFAFLDRLVVLARIVTLRLVRFVSVQPRYNLLFREIERELLPLAQEENLAVIPFNPLAGGLLSGKYQLDEKPEKGRFSAEVGQFGAAYRARYWHQREFVTIGKLREIAGEEGEALPKLAVAWILANPAITSVILGASRTEQLTDTLAAADYNLPPELKTKLDDLSAEYRRGDAAR
jgi:1-deoxyxylulose-5-phosphate synthase